MPPRADGPGADGAVDGSVFRAALPRVADQGLGRGITIRPLCESTSSGWQCDEPRPSLSVTRSVIEQNRMMGILVVASDATVDASVIRATLPRASDQREGSGLHVQLLRLDTSEGQQCDATQRAGASLTGSLLERNHLAGVNAIASDLVVDASIVRLTLPSPIGESGGRGMNVQLGCAQSSSGWVCDPEAKSNASITRSLIEDNFESGLLFTGADAVVDRTVVRQTSPPSVDQPSGRGITAQCMCYEAAIGEFVCDKTALSRATISRSLVERSSEHGLIVMYSQATVDSTVVQHTAPHPATATFGDGITVFGFRDHTYADLSNVAIVDSARAGLAGFDAPISIRQTRIQCAAFDINGEWEGDSDSAISDDGGNSCGCPTADSACVLVSAGLAPPAPLVTHD